MRFLVAVVSVLFYGFAFADSQPGPVNLMIGGRIEAFAPPIFFDNVHKVPSNGADLVPDSAAHLGPIHPGELPRSPFLNIAPAADISVWMAQGSTLASQIIATAYANEKSTVLKRTYDKIFIALKQSALHVPPRGQDFVACTAGTLAFSFVGKPGIYLCSYLMKNSNVGTGYLAEVLVHESIHVMGFADECDTTKFEVAIMRTSGYGVQMRSGYWARCGIQ